MINFSIIGVVVCTLVQFSSGVYHEGPVIGVLAQELLPSIKKVYPNYTSYIAASYVKAVEAAGARVVPIHIGKEYAYYKKQLSLVNGVVLPGGGVLFNKKKGYADAGDKIYKIAKQLNNKGDYFPILGVCLGFELILYVANSKKELRTRCHSNNVGLPLDFVNGFKKSKLFGEADPKIISILANRPVTSNHHSWCITPNSMTENKLDKTWKTLSTNKDRNGTIFVSSVESRKYPFAAVQWHPEKSIYEWKSEQNNPHSREAILSQRHFYDWVAIEASKSRHAYPSIKEKTDALIGNYQVFYSSGKGLYFEQIYLFK